MQSFIRHKILRALPYAVFTVLLCLLIPSITSSDDTSVEPTPEEVINEVSRMTGLASDSVGLLMEESPGLFGNINDTVTALKVVDLLYNARDAEALAEIYNWQFGNIMNGLPKRIYPPAMNTFITVVKVYKASLKLMRDWVIIPSLEATIYERYKAARGGVQDFRYANPEEAYMEATARGSYFPAKQKMYDRLVKAKGYNKSLIGDKLKKHLWHKVDAFWKKRLEAVYQRELFRKSRQKLIDHMWAKRQADLEAIKKAAAGLGKDPRQYFLTREDIPEKWGLRREKTVSLIEFTPRLHKSGAHWEQKFSLYPSSLMLKQYSNGNAVYYDANGTHNSIMSNITRVYIRPSLEIHESGYRFYWEDKVKEEIKAGKSLTTIRYDNGQMHELGVPGVDVGYIIKVSSNSRDDYHSAFVKGDWYVVLEMRGFPNSFTREENAKIRGRKGASLVSESPVSLEFVRYLTKRIASKIPSK